MIPVRRAAACAALATLTACAPATREPAVAPSPTPSLLHDAPLPAEELAGRVGCEPSMRVRAAELRQGVCRAAAGSFVVTSFTTERGRRDWLEYTEMYGGTYLVGRRWIITAAPPVLERLRGTLGGDVYRARGTSP